jgi:rsbT co-antagonist protein RsbR
MTVEAEPAKYPVDCLHSAGRTAELEKIERDLQADLLRARETEDALRAQLKAQELVIARLKVAQALVDSAFDGITLTALDRHVVYANEAFKAMSGFGERAVGSPLAVFYEQEEFERLTSEVMPALLKAGTWSGLLKIKRPDGSIWMGQTSAFIITDESGAPTGMAAFFRDTTAQIESDRTQQRLRAELRALGTPLLPIDDRVIAMPLIGNISSDRASQIMEALLGGITMHRASVAILDITGVEVIDMQAANAIVCAARAASLLGTEVVLTGTSPNVAKTLVEIGADLRGIITRSTLRSGIAYALARRPQRST